VGGEPEQQASQQTVGGMVAVQVEQVLLPQASQAVLVFTAEVEGAGAVKVIMALRSLAVLVAHQFMVVAVVEVEGVLQHAQ